MSHPHGLKLKLKLPASASAPASADPPPSADAAPGGPPPPSGVKLKLSLSGTGIKPASSANVDEEGSEEQEDGGRNVDQSAKATGTGTTGNPTTKIKLNFGKLASAPASQTIAASTHAEEPIPYSADAGDEAVQGSSSATPAKRGRGVSSARGKRGTAVGGRGRGRGRPRGRGRGRGKVTFVDGADGNADGEDVVVDEERDGNEDAEDSEVDHVQVAVKDEGPVGGLGEPTGAIIEQKMDVDPPVEDVAKAEPIPEAPTPTPLVVPGPMPAAPVSSVTFAIPSPELSPPPELPPTTDDPMTAGPTGEPSRERSESVMTALGGPTDMGLPMTGLTTTTNSEIGTPTGLGDEGATPGAAGRVVLQGKGRPYFRAKKPLKDVLRKVLADIRRKDSYGLFLEPVDEEEFPGYLDTIGGRNNAMDLATMEEKIEGGRYRSMEQFEADVEKMISAAQVFNPDDSLVHREAGKIKTLAEKHISKNRPLIRTPSPSPEPAATPGGTRRTGVGSRMSSGLGGTPFDTGTPLSGGNARSVSPGAGEDATKRGAIIDELPPWQVIPEQMLDFPPNSDVAMTVGWYFTGGKRLRSRKEQRAKEKWDGQWREWYTTGDRNLREADDLFDLFEDGFTSESRGEKLGMPRTIDWTDEAMRANEVWQPQPTYTGFEHEERPPKIPMRRVNHWDFGRFQSLPAEYGWSATRPAGFDRAEFVSKVKMDVRPPEIGPPGMQMMPWLRPEEDPLRYLKAVSTGEDVVGEAYLKSVEAFVRGAEEGAKRNWHVMRDEEGPRKRVKIEDGQEGIDEEEKDLGLGKSLAQYVENDWRGGVFNRKTQRTIDLATKAYKLIREEQRRPSNAKVTGGTTSQTLQVDDMELSIMKALVQDIAAKIPIRQEVLEWAARKDGLELAALLHQIQDFSATGPAGGPPSAPAERAKWFADSLRFTGEQIVRESKRLMDKATETGSFERDEEDNQRIREIRLNLLGLAKNVPVHELRPMSKDEAARLPSAVRNLIKIVPDKPKV